MLVGNRRERDKKGKFKRCRSNQLVVRERIKERKKRMAETEVKGKLKLQ